MKLIVNEALLIEIFFKKETPGILVEVYLKVIIIFIPSAYMIVITPCADGWTLKTKLLTEKAEL